MNKFNLIKPGSKFNKMGISNKSAVIRKNISIKFPSRIHITPIDCNRFDFGMPGGGGIGFAIDLTNILSFSSANDLKVKSLNKKYENIIIHFVKLEYNRYCVESQAANSPLDTVFYCKYFKESRQPYILSYLYTWHELLKVSFS